MKTCRICKTPKELKFFGNDKDNRDKKNTICKPCNKIYMAKYKEPNKVSQRKYQLKRYNLTQDDFNKILASQKGICAVCGGPPTVYDKYVVDHDHDTGAVRGLICQHCNTGLGRFKDSTKLLESAKRYINNSRVNKFRELEIKLRVPVLGMETAFIEWMSTVGASQYVRVTGQDVYWEKAGSVIRHRLNGATGGEITVKNRTSENSTVDRVEIDLFLSKETAPEDVSAFMTLSGYQPAVAITKTSHIFTVSQDDCEITVVYYEVTDDLGSFPKTAYVEVEINKDADVKVSTATRILREWQDRLTERGLEPVEGSLWEIFSGKRYASVG